MRFFLVILLTVLLHASFLHAEEPNFKFTFGSNLGNFPLEINKISKNKKILPGIKINSWSLLPNFSNYVGDKKLFKFSENKISKNSIYFKLKLRF
tara:strand:- start:272 stop:556 length:285 start_codon:yes stop_codon:yes gene_type:complete